MTDQTLSLVQLEAQIAELTQKANEIRTAERSGVVTKIRELITAYNLTAEDIFQGVKAKKESSAKTPAAVKYRDANGNTWSGRGLTPRWLAGKHKEEFLITPETAPV